VSSILFEIPVFRILITTGDEMKREGKGQISNDRQPSAPAMSLPTLAENPANRELAMGYPLPQPVVVASDGGGIAHSSADEPTMQRMPSESVVVVTTTTTTTTYSLPIICQSACEPSDSSLPPRGVQFRPWHCLGGGAIATGISNFIWLVFGGGLAIGLLWAVFSVLACLTICCIPAGINFLKFSKFAFFPFNKVLYRSRTICAWPESCMNAVWLPFGIMLWAVQTALGLAYCLTIVGIPIGMLHFQMCHLFLWPFGAEVTGSASSSPTSAGGTGPVITAVLKETVHHHHHQQQQQQQRGMPVLPPQAAEEMTRVSTVL